MSLRRERPELRIGMVGAGTMARAHSAALSLIGSLYADLPARIRLVAVADINGTLAADLADRYGYERVVSDWRSVVAADDVDVVVACLPPMLDREVVLAAAAAGKHIVCEKPLAENAAIAAELLAACRAAGVFHGLGLGYRWSSAVRAIRDLIVRGDLGEIRSMRGSFLLDYGADPDVPFLWRFQRALSGGGLAIDTGYHLIDCGRFLIGEIGSVQAITTTFISERPMPGSDAMGNTGGAGGAAGQRAMGHVDVEDAAAALVTFEGGAYGVLETSRNAVGKRVSLTLEVFGSLGSADWDLERPDEFRVCLAGDLETFGYRRVMLNPSHPGAGELLIAGADGTGLGWLGQECAMWNEYVSAIVEGRRGRADFEDGVRVNAVIDALYASASSGNRTAVEVPAGL